LIRANKIPTFLPMTLTIGSALTGQTTMFAPAGIVVSSTGVWDALAPKSALAVKDMMPIISSTTGRLEIKALGLPAKIPVTYKADGTTLGTARTSKKGDLWISAWQGGTGTLPSKLDLFSVDSVTVLDGSGNVLVTAQF
jgi:hypothetical protein